MSTLTKAERAYIAEWWATPVPVPDRVCCSRAMVDIPRLLAHIEALEAVVEVVGHFVDHYNSCAECQEDGALEGMCVGAYDKWIKQQSALQRLQERGP